MLAQTHSTNPQGLDYYELTPEENTFPLIYAFVTQRCNMNCANCFVPNRKGLDMDRDKLIRMLSRLPDRVELRLIGGEPTLHSELPEIIRETRALGHKPVLVTNGLKLADPDYVDLLHGAGLREVNISMNGADDDRIYQITDHSNCAERKMAAVRNCHERRMRIMLGAILMKSVNEHVPGRLLEIAKDFGGRFILNFRNVAELGRHAVKRHENFSFDEMISLLSAQSGKTPEYIRGWNKLDGYSSPGVVVFPLDKENPYRTIWIRITDWNPAPGSIPDPGSKRRGRVTQDFKIAPLFEHVKLNEFVY